MKATSLITLGALIASCTFAAAQAPERQKGQPRQVPPAVLKEFDKDGDGKLNEEEATAARTAMRERAEAFRKEMLAKFDADGDGKLSPEEAKTAREARMKEMLEKFDKDGDGKLSEEERKAAREAGFMMPPQRGEGGPRGEGGQRRKRPEGGGERPARPDRPASPATPPAAE